ncbi:hybrid PKS-NRPS protein [Metarhizium acridum CQMa 102]|uniref:Hybrid PKS-NRPS protein n=1 Tax=Metarhizium acridum (strain CQMa 102) TaxID=655827 RepID=E9EAQ9_METAQ|nr:hybrid PKS-NRPS protein [Metarhizium acridum CQMa 102]EFY86943.1 hybrid PKS-NRPS protein [Metarhizium acridum CQMa 102]
MSVALCRSLFSEYPHIKIQHVDVESCLDQGTMHRISGAVLSLLRSEKPSADILWSFEPELILEDEKWYIPRLLPDEKPNQRLTSTTMDLQSVPCIQAAEQTPLTTINVTKSLLHPVATEGPKSVSSSTVLATANASSVSVSEHFVFDLPEVVADGAAVLQRVAFSVLAEKFLFSCLAGCSQAGFNVHFYDFPEATSIAFFGFAQNYASLVDSCRKAITEMVRVEELPIDVARAFKRPTYNRTLDDVKGVVQNGRYVEGSRYL